MVTFRGVSTWIPGATGLLPLKTAFARPSGNWGLLPTHGRSASSQRGAKMGGNTVDGRNPAPPEDSKNHVNHGINCQAQLITVVGFFHVIAGFLNHQQYEWWVMKSLLRGVNQSSAWHGFSMFLVMRIFCAVVVTWWIGQFLVTQKNKTLTSFT